MILAPMALATAAMAVGVAAAACAGQGDPASDWLVTPCKDKTVFFIEQGGSAFRLANGIIQHSLATDPESGSIYTSSLRSLITGQEKLSQVVADAALVANGVQVLVGGQHNGTARGAVRTTFSGDFRVSNTTQAGNFSFVPGTRGSRPDRSWPPAGVRVEFDHVVPCSAIGAADAGDLSVLTATLVFEMYDSTSSMGRRLVASHNCSRPVQLHNMSVVLMETVKDRIVTTHTDASISEGARVSVDSPNTDAVSATRYIPVSASHKWDAAFPSYGPGVTLQPVGAPAAANERSWRSQTRFQSFFVAVAVHDATNPSASGPRGAVSRFSQEVNVMWRTLAPQTEQYPIAFAAVCTGGSAAAGTAPVPGSTGYWCYDQEGTSGIFRTIDQAAEVGFEMVKFAQNMNATWRSFIGNEFESDANITWFKNITDYARAKGVEIGAYQLLRNARSATALNQCAPDNAASEAMDGFDTMDFLPPFGTGRGCHNGNQSGCTGGPGCCSLCAATEFYDELEASMLRWWDETGMVAVDQDGAESNTPCSNASHTHHRGIDDSVWQQWLSVHHTFHQYMDRGGFNVGMPGHWLEGGQAKVPGGYSEETFSLPRWTWIHRVRERIIRDPQLRDLTEPNSNRLFPLPLVPYHPTQEGGPSNGSWVPVRGYESSATVEPLEEHTVELEWALSQGFGTGVFMPPRGYRAYSGPKSKEVMTRWVAFAKRYRTALITSFGTLQCGTTCWGTAGAAPGQRCNVTSWDGVIHWTPAATFPELQEVALAVIWNPLPAVQATNVTLPLYYSGLSTLNGTRAVTAAVREQEGPPSTLPLSANDTVSFPIELQPMGVTYLVVEPGSPAAL